MARSVAPMTTCAPVDPLDPTPTIPSKYAPVQIQDGSVYVRTPDITE
ncbi:hypothetical protein [Streptomyces sp. SA15]|nr:hypothetical protein [Streptomyces sp. SA15]